MTYLLWISYKGTRYAGFQIQPNAPTVCAVLQDAMQAVFGCRPDVKGCSRTDAGVHARRFALSFCYTGKVPMQKIVPALNAHLPPVRSGRLPRALRRPRQDLPLLHFERAGG